ncbi:hypothetical protein GCM10011348_12390 [Marinobacterium nitratireducens]|uniref:Coiled coil domain-containing protein n=1 Tax=Marinobacterium nitratireducens TaxID=518897 RepID=A0A917ZA08_9GAMM|nr:coiled coil domain-containing protein [Marinobacterium nitratireducens]GGO79051.1 hypothetical protein GCM10011348_12390 [Marinobacterium nitratireducens]
MSMKDDYIKRLQAQLDVWDAEIQKLKAQAEVAKADARLEYHKQLEELKKQRQQAQQRLTELREASNSAWDDLKAGADRAWDSMADAIKSARERFK